MVTLIQLPLVTHVVSVEIPKEVLAILAAIDGKPYSKAVWTLAKYRSGYSLKLFWGVE